MRYYSYYGYFCPGWVGEWGDRWMDVKAVLRIAHSIQKITFCSSPVHVALNKLGHFNAFQFYSGVHDKHLSKCGLLLHIRKKLY